MSDPTSAAPTVPPLKNLRVLAAALMSAVVVFAIVAWFVVPGRDYPPSWVAWFLGAVALAAFALAEMVGYRAAALAPGARPTQEQAVGAFQASMMLRLAATEGVAILALIMMFVVTPPTFMTYLIGAVLALILMTFHVWPSDRAIGKVQHSLEREGGQSFLRDALMGNEPGTERDTQAPFSPIQGG